MKDEKRTCGLADWLCYEVHKCSSCGHGGPIDDDYVTHCLDCAQTLTCHFEEEP
jgi:hypothetical protein